MPFSCAPALLARSGVVVSLYRPARLIVVGSKLWWRHKPRGGYGFALVIPVTVIEVWPKSALVRFERPGDRSPTARQERRVRVSSLFDKVAR